MMSVSARFAVTVSLKEHGGSVLSSSTIRICEFRKRCDVSVVNLAYERLICRGDVALDAQF